MDSGEKKDACIARILLLSLFVIEQFMKQDLASVVWKEGKHYVAQCLNVDISSFGESREEALANLDEALALYFEEDCAK